MITTAVRCETIQDEIEIVREMNSGCVSPQALVDFARDPETLLHSKFEWNNKKAGDEYRLWQARQILSVFVTVEETDKGPIEVRAYISLPDDRRTGVGYRSTKDIMGDEDRRKELLAMAYRDARAFRAKYANFKELVEINEAIDRTLNR